MKHHLILIADDNPENLSILIKYLRESDLLTTIIKSPNGKITCEIAENKLPDLIISDWFMPEMDGIETIKNLRRKKSTKDIPIIITSGKMTSSEDLQLALKSGAVDFIKKPIDKTEFLARVKSMLKISWAYRRIKIQKNEILKKNKNITDSILYAKRIQTALLPPQELLTNILPDHFILFQPRDIVSGDFYWYKQIGDFTILTAADCTGHGIPGALMSMLGISFLNEIVTPKNAQNPAQILDELSTALKSALRQTGKDEDPLDGIDIALICFSKKDNILYYSGANNPLLMVRNNKLKKWEPNLMSAGFNFRASGKFTVHKIRIEKEDVIYIFSDGYKDQFGGEKGNKFRSENFHRLLLQIHNEPMKTQNKMLIENFNNWKGSHSQLDDVLVIGLQF